MNATQTVSDWEGKAASLQFKGDAFVGGDYVAAESGETIPATSPIDEKTLIGVAAAGEPDVDKAVAAARRAFESGVWSGMAPAERKAAMFAFAAGVRANVEELGLLITLEVGKPIGDALMEAELVARCLDFYGEAIDKVYGEIGATAPSSLALVTHEPIGVVAAISPWNYPALMPTWKIAPALAAGNSVILKPAEQSPLIAIKLGEIASASGFPDGVFNVLPGVGEVVGAALGRHMDVDAISFTGSTAVGKMFLRYAGESNMKSVSLECGGKSPQIILADAPDLAAAAEAVAEGIFVNAGEMCNAGSRLLIDGSIHDDFMSQVVAAAKPWYPKHPFEADAKMGTMVDRDQFDRVVGYIEKGKSEGATLVEGGAAAGDQGAGLYLEPTIFTDVKADMTIAQEEIFGPVLATIPFTSVEEAVTTANGTVYGLAAAVWTRDISRAHSIAQALRAGSVYVNCYDRGDNSLPFGGYKQSGLGVDKSLAAMRKYTRTKMTWVEL